MPRLTATIDIDDLIDALDLDDVPSDFRKPQNQSFDCTVSVDQDTIDDEASDAEADRIGIDVPTLREGIRATIAGDWSQARILLHRALDEDDEARRAIEEEFRIALEQRARTQRRSGQ